MKKDHISCAFNTRFESPCQGFLLGFDHPIKRELDTTNSWVVLSILISWDELCSVYLHQTGNKSIGRAPINPLNVSSIVRNPIEGKFVQAKTGYGLNRIKARLKKPLNRGLPVSFWFLTLSNWLRLRSML